MALTNIFNEPRREITESAIGISLFGIYATADWYFANWFHEITGGDVGGCPIPVALGMGVVFTIAFVAAIAITHSAGESICNALQKHGDIHLRPRQRFN